MIDSNVWPPEQPTSFTPLLFIHHQGHRTPDQVKVMAELTCTGDIDKVTPIRQDSYGYEESQKVLDMGRATKEIEEILDPLEKSKEASFILIEGAPGIGKSVLLKEIAFRWGRQQLLKNFELVLLVCLRDPSLQQIESVDELLQLFYKRHKNTTEITSACSEYLSENDGKTLTLLLDGYDEYPSDLQENSLIADIIKRQVLPLCGLVVSSRPHASENLRKQATIRVDILGFTETEREHYIKQALPDQPHKVEEVTQYLHQQPSVGSICFSPFNMVILIYLYKLGISLPKHSTELYRHFICSTVSRHLSKFGNPLTNDITDLTDLPEPYNRVIQQLSKLSLEAVTNNKLIFTLDEITAACPDIAAIPGAINGFGLLQAVQHFGLCGKTMTLNFIHFTIQEFLAAHYISVLPPSEELKVIEMNFWNNIHFNVFSMYILITKGQRPSFKIFLSGGNKEITISQEFLKDQLKCFRLYRCFNEADDHRMCNTIEQAEIFEGKEINCNPWGLTLTGNDMECMSLFLTSSFNKEWEWLYLDDCNIQDKEFNFLYQGLQHSEDVIINNLSLGYNLLTMQSSSLISKFTVKHKVKMLKITGNHTIGEDQRLYSMLIDPSTTLMKLIMSYIKLSSKAATALFIALKDNKKLKQLMIQGNDITDRACDAITTALQRNNCLVRLSMWRNPLTSEAMKNIVQCLMLNNTLQLLELPKCPQDIQKNITDLQEIINNNRESQELQPKKLDIHFSY